MMRSSGDVQSLGRISRLSFSIEGGEEREEERVLGLGFSFLPISFRMMFFKKKF